jgi:hypothetical protein
LCDNTNAAFDTISAEEVMKLLEAAVSCPQEGEAVPRSDALLQAMQAMETTLSSSSVEHQVDVLFAALKRAVHRDYSSNQVQSLLRMWQPCLGAASHIMKAVEAECSTGDCFELFQRCTAGAAGALKVMKSIATQCELVMGTGCMPLYLVRNPVRLRVLALPTC